MKVHLMFRDRDFNPQRKLPPIKRALEQDLELGVILEAMADNDGFLYETARNALMLSLTEPDEILYRQEVLRDCLKNPAVVREIYEIAVDTVEGEKMTFVGGENPEAILSKSVLMLRKFMGLLGRLKAVADKNAERFESEGFTAFFAMIRNELDDDFFSRVEGHLKELEFRDGILISAGLGQGNKGAGYRLCKMPEEKMTWRQHLFTRKDRFQIPVGNDNFGVDRAVAELKSKGLNQVANSLAQSAEHILQFFGILRTELAFYIGCLNLYERIGQLGEPVAFPVPAASTKREHAFQGLYDLSLALTVRQRVVGNDLQADGKELAVITGANQGGKSTFLRGIGQAQLMMQCGMFVPAYSFRANICGGLYTHYNREEDAAMGSGKLDEELKRMSDIADLLKPHDMVMFNESFSSTNEREGSLIAGQIISALLEKHIKVFFVTHLYEFAHGLYERKPENVIFLRAERHEGGGRPFKLREGEPLMTSYGEDLYRELFEIDKRRG